MLIALSDFRHASRLLLKNPVLSLLTIIVLAGGLGISLFTFAALNTMIYGDLPVPEGNSIVRIGVGNWVDFEPLDALELAALRTQGNGIEDLGVFRESRVRVGEPGSDRNLRLTESDWRIFEFSRTPPVLGRGFVAEDGVPGGEPVAVLSHRIWQTVYAGDPSIVGDVVSVGGSPTRIAGVMPEGYAFPVNTQIWLPLQQDLVDPVAYTESPLSAYARLGSGATVEAVEAELSGIVRRVREENGVVDDEFEPVAILSFQEESWGVLGTVVFGVLNLLSISILSLAAINVGNLLLARTNERIVEVGVRIALGAPRLRLVVQTTLENLIVCVVGGVIAVYLARRALEWTESFLGALIPEDLPFWWTWSLDRGLLTAAGVFLLFTVVVVSVLPAFCVSRADPNRLLRDGTRATGGLAMGPISRALVTVQVALIASVMIIGSAIAVLAYRATHFDSGMNTENLLMTVVEPPPETYATADERLQFYEQVLGQIRQGAGLEAAAVMLELYVTQFAPEGADYADPDARPGAWLNVLSESPIPVGPTLLAGRGFDNSDTAGGPRAAIVSESLARAEWPKESAVGKRIDVWMGGADAETHLVVGVVSDRQSDPLGISPVDTEAIYVPSTQVDLPATRYIVRHAGDAGQAMSAISAAIARVDRAASIEINSFEYALEQMTLVGRTMTRLFALSGAFAILLAVTGIYGMSSNAVVLKRHEIGLRRALGASNTGIVSVFLRRGVRQLAVGLGFSGLLSSLVLVVLRQGASVGGWMLTFLALSVLLTISVCLLGSIYLSVRRVLRMEPSSALRHA